MAFNGIGGYTNAPGQIPWELVVLYFIVALAVVFVIGRRSGSLRRFSTMDLVYIGVGAALSVVWEFYIGAFLQRAIPSGLTNILGVAFLGRLFIVFVIAALVRKVGVGMLSLAIFNILSDIFFYGFGGEPIYTLYEALTYGLFLDIGIALTSGNLFGVMGRMKMSASTSTTPSAGGGMKMAAAAGTTTMPGMGSASGMGPSPTLLAIIEGAIIGFTWSFPDSLFYSAFFGPLLYGSTVNWARIIVTIIQFIPGDIIVGILAGLAAIRISRAV